MKQYDIRIKFSHVKDHNVIHKKKLFKEYLLT